MLFVVARCWVMGYVSYEYFEYDIIIIIIIIMIIIIIITTTSGQSNLT